MRTLPRQSLRPPLVSSSMKKSTTSTWNEAPRRSCESQFEVLGFMGRSDILQRRLSRERKEGRMLHLGRYLGAFAVSAQFGIGAMCIADLGVSSCLLILSPRLLLSNAFPTIGVTNYHSSQNATADPVCPSTPKECVKDPKPSRIDWASGTSGMSISTARSAKSTSERSWSDE